MTLLAPARTRRKFMYADSAEPITRTVLFQCKRWKGSVSAREIRDFRGAMVGRADKGLIHNDRSIYPCRCKRGNKRRTTTDRSRGRPRTRRKINGPGPWG